MDRLDAMAIFVSVAELGSLSAAARTRAISLASVSRQLAALEDHLGARLLARSTRRLALTGEGRVFYERAKRILSDVAETERTLSQAEATASGHLHISAPALLGRLHVAPLLPEFLARYPRVSVALTLTDRRPRLIEDEIDLALRIGPLESSDLIARRLGSVHLVVCAAASYLASRGTPLQPEDLAAHDCLVFNAVPEGYDWHFQRGKRKLTIRVPARLAANSLDPLITAALGGAGLVRAPCWQVGEHIIAGRLTRVLDSYERPPAPIHALLPPGRRRAARVRAFADFLMARWAAPPFDCRLAPAGAIGVTS